MKVIFMDSAPDDGSNSRPSGSIQPHFSELYKGKKDFSVDECRKRRQEDSVQIRKNKRENLLNSRRNIDPQLLAEQNLSQISDEPLLDCKFVEFIIRENPKMQLIACRELHRAMDKVSPTTVPSALSRLRILPRLTELLLTGSEDVRITIRWIFTKLITSSISPNGNILESELEPLRVSEIIRHIIDLLRETINLSSTCDSDILLDELLLSIGLLTGASISNASYAFNCGINTPLKIILQKARDIPSTIVGHSIWLLSQLFSHTEEEPESFGSELHASLLRELYPFIDCSDEIIRTDALRTLMNAVYCGRLAQVVSSPPFIFLLVSRVTDTNIEVAKIAMKTMNTIVQEYAVFTSAFLDPNINLVRYLSSIIENPIFEKDVCHLISNICAEGKEKVAFLFSDNCGIFKFVVKSLANSTFQTRKEAGFAICYACELGDFNIRSKLISLGIVTHLSDLLTVMDGQLVMQVLEALSSLLETYQLAGSDEVRNQLEECGGYEKILFLQESQNIEIMIRSTEINEQFFRDVEEEEKYDIGFHSEGHISSAIVEDVSSTIDNVVNLVAIGNVGKEDDEVCMEEIQWNFV